MGGRPALRALAAELGILPSFVAQGGGVVQTPDRVREAILAAMRIDASSEAAARRARAARARAAAARLVAPVLVVRAAALRRARIPVTLPAGGRGRRAWEIVLETEEGAEHRAEGRTHDRATGTITLPLPAHPPPGYHRLRVRLDGPARAHEGEQRLIVVPPRCLTPAETHGQPVFGLCANLYAVRSARDWGIGDFGDLRTLARWAGEIGAAFVGVNPLHALENRGPDISPYSPVSRLFRNELYLDVAAVPELRTSVAARTYLARRDVTAVLARLRAGDRVDYEAVRACKRPVIALLHRAFVSRHRDAMTARGRAYAAYRARRGSALDDFATFRVLADTHGPDWRHWPRALRDPAAPAVAAWRAEHLEAVDRERWLQFELDRQLAMAAAAAHAAGVSLGIYQDLAIGSAPGGSDRWAFPDLFAEGVHVGAPPDLYSATGQDWGLPPLDPHRLAADGYCFWIRLLRAALAHAGALRIDHVLGLVRQFWIPAGRSGRDGAYVRFPAEDLLGILALESRRAGAVVVGEDLGTVPPGLPRILARWGVLSSRVLYFEQTRRGFRAAARYPARALVTANTHDMAPLAGYWVGRDLELGRAAGLIPTDAALAAARRERARERRALLRRLVHERVLTRRAAGALAVVAAALRPPAKTTSARPAVPAAALVGAVHAFLCRTPAALVGVALDDLTGEVEPVNLPGVGLAGHPSWSRRLRLTLAAMRRDPGVAAALAGTRARARRRRWRQREI